MKVLLVNTGMTGHYISYLNALVEELSTMYDIIVLQPKLIDNINAKQYKYSSNFIHDRNLKCMFGWLEEIKNIADKEKVHIIHFLDADILHRFLGCGLDIFKNFHTITYNVPISSDIK